ncbi:MAG: FtsX-like permease family protein [Flavobacteriales bacterium]|nr:FtsX-like permease family protein [Flavobacteriales bacterium]
MLIKLAWRNIWRNKRRTAITVASIFFAVFFAVFMRSMQLGFYGKMIDSVVRFYSGHVQVHAKGYWDDQILDNSFELNDPELKAIRENPNVEMAANRLEGFALSSSGDLTKGVLMIGMDPELEDRLMDLEPKIQSGALFGANDRSVMVAEKVAEYYKLAVGDTMVFISQGYHGVSAAAKYPVSSIVRFTSLVLNERAVMFPMKEAQNFFGAEGRATSVAVILGNPNKMDKVVNELTASLDTSKYEVMSWEEALPELVQAIEADGAGGLIMLMILYMVVSFGMFGTVLMLIQERVYEFGVLLSIGMGRLKLWTVVFLESIFTTLIGAVLGVIGVYPLVLYFNHNPYELTGPAAEAILDQGWEPVLPASLDPSIATTHMLIVMVVSILIAFYPAFIIRKLNPVEARRN